MPVIPRYDQRTRPALRGLQAPSPIVSAGDDLRTLGKVAGLAGGLWDSAASMQAVRETDARWREAQAHRARNPEVTETATREAFAAELPPAEREAFAQVSSRRAAAFDAETQGRISQVVQEQAAELSRRRQVLGLDEYHRLADLDEPQAMASLASAIAEQGERLAAGGVDSATAQTARRELFAQAVVERIAHRAAIDPDGAEVLLDKDGAMIPDAEQATLRASIRTERIRQDARGFAARLMAASDAGPEDLESALQLADAEAHGDPERMRAYRAAAIGAQRKARARREEREGAAWDGVRPFLTPDAAAPWTELPGPIWSALSDRQKETVRAMLEAPERESDPVVVSHLKEIAAQDPERFRMLDLGALGTGLDAADHSFWRELQGEARRNTDAWKGERAYLAQVGRAVRASIPADLDGPTRAGLEVNLNQVVADAEVMEGRRLSWAELLAVCQQGVAPAQSNPSAQDKELNRRLWSRGYSGDDLQFDPRTGQIYRWVTVPIPGQFHGTRIEKVIVSDAEVRMGRNRRLGVEAYADPYPMSKEEGLMRTFELGGFSDGDVALSRSAAGVGADLPTGIPDDYLPMLSKIESGDRAYVKAETSSASGYYQFTKKTWESQGGVWGNDNKKSFGGLTPSADEQRQRATALTLQNANSLRRAGIPVNKASLYAAHFLGIGGAIRILRADEATPVTEVTTEGQRRANRTILGGDKTVADFFDWLHRKTGDQIR